MASDHADAAYKYEQRSIERERLSLEKAQSKNYRVVIFLEGVGIVLIGATLGATIMQWRAMTDTLREMQKQTQPIIDAAKAATAGANAATEASILTREQLSATEGAVLESSNIFIDVDGKVRMELVNLGKSIARDIAGDFIVRREHLPARTPIGRDHPFRFAIPHLNAAGRGAYVTGPFVSIPGLLSAYPIIMNQPRTQTFNRETVSIQGTLSYHDGFKVVSERICKVWLASYTGNTAWTACEQIREDVDRIREQHALQQQGRNTQKQ